MPMIDPYRLMEQFFDLKNGLTLKEGDDGDPILKDFSDISAIIERVPYNQLPSVTKIFTLKPANIGLLFAGAAAIGNHSIKNLIDEFRSDEKVSDYLKGTYTISGTARRLHDHLMKFYEEEYPSEGFRPSMEILVSGYSRKHNQPEVQKIQIGSGHQDGQEGVQSAVARGEYKVVFGGQHDVIQRVINGLDFDNYVRYLRKVDGLMETYHEIVKHSLEKQGIKADIPSPFDLEEDGRLDLYSIEWVQGIETEYANFSEQASIDLVDFLVDVMCRSQEFGNRLPTVGGDIHIAIITKSGGFRWISKEEYSYKGYGVPKHD